MTISPKGVKKKPAAWHGKWKSRRLVKDMKTALIKRMDVALFGARLTRMDEYEHEVAEQMLDFHLGAYKKELNALPTRFFDYSVYIQVNMGDLPEGRYYHYGFRGNDYHGICRLLLKKKRRIPSLLTNGWPSIEALVPNSEINRKIVEEILKKYQAKGMDLAEDRKKFNDTSEAVLQGVTTEAKLAEMWPEAVEYLIPPEVTHELVPHVKAAHDVFAEMSAKKDN